MKKLLRILLFGLNILAAASLLVSYLAPFINPSRCILPALFGLAYPYILLINLIFVFYYLVRLNKALLLSLAVILIGWNHLNNFLPIRLKSPDTVVNPGGANTLRILSYNVRAFNMYNWSKEENARTEMLRYISSQNADVACLQEYYTSESTGNREQDIDRALRTMPHKSVYYSIQGNQGSAWGIATYSKHPVIRKSRIPFANTHNAAMYTDILFNDDTLRIFNIHLQSLRFRERNYDFLNNIRIRYSEEQVDGFREIGSHLKRAFIQRAEQAEVISNYIGQSPHPVILAGDFNDTPLSYAYRQIRKGMQDAFRKSGRGFGNTYAGNLPYLRIDYILYDPSFVPDEFRRTKIRYSDHYPVQALLRFRPGETVN
ncbi:MAG: endonuclease/exonuclease/phosphatase family protein [Bacteroidales bacterium]|nr:endonuclease/exonuclease/phosphatase family protein [Bacteroidales bacterium]